MNEFKDDCSCGLIEKIVNIFKSNIAEKSAFSCDINTDCPVCGQFKLNEIGQYEICPICGWEDDPVQRKDPDFRGGANKMSLNEARVEFISRFADEQKNA